MKPLCYAFNYLILSAWGDQGLLINLFSTIHFSSPGVVKLNVHLLEPLRFAP